LLIYHYIINNCLLVFGCNGVLQNNTSVKSDNTVIILPAVTRQHLWPLENGKWGVWCWLYPHFYSPLKEQQVHLYIYTHVPPFLTLSPQQHTQIPLSAACHSCSSHNIYSHIIFISWPIHERPAMLKYSSKCS